MDSGVFVFFWFFEFLVFGFNCFLEIHFFFAGLNFSKLFLFFRLLFFCLSVFVLYVLFSFLFPIFFCFFLFFSFALLAFLIFAFISFILMPLLGKSAIVADCGTTYLRTYQTPSTLVTLVHCFFFHSGIFRRRGLSVNPPNGGKLSKNLCLETTLKIHRKTIGCW